jgi:hypothetical protein
MIAYKVARKYKGQYISTGSGLTPYHALCLTYKEGEITIAAQGTVGIFIFKSLEDALCYKDIDHVFKVETLAPIKPLNKLIKDTYLLYEEYFSYKKYKNDLVSTAIANFCYIVPKGSFLCQKIRVLHELTDEDLQNL